MKKLELQSIIKEELRKVLSEAYVPNNVAEFAKEKGITSLVKKVAGWAEKNGKTIVGGTAIGKNYSTLILDLTRNGAEIRINTDTEDVTLNGVTIVDVKTFKKALSVDEPLNEATTYPIGIQEIRIGVDNALVIIIGNSSADLVGFSPDPAVIAKLDTIMKGIDDSAKRVPGPKGVQFTEGQIRYRLMRGASIYPDRLLKAMKQVNSLNMTHSY